jgi:putative spermidine/putrescine transport system ATP-binding protein
MLRPERIRLGEAAGSRVSGTVREVQYFGAFTRLKVDAADAQLQADLPEAPGMHWPAPGEAVHLHWDARAVHALDAGP